MKTDNEYRTESVEIWAPSIRPAQKCTHRPGDRSAERGVTYCRNCGKTQYEIDREMVTG